MARTGVVPTLMLPARAEPVPASSTMPETVMVATSSVARRRPAVSGIFNYSLNLVWNGTIWTKQPYRETGTMNAVSCASATFCAGVGVISDSAETTA